MSRRKVTGAALAVWISVPIIGVSVAGSAAPRQSDRDRDGLSNRQEVRHRTNPRKRDTDRDRLSDGLEVKRYRTNPRRRDTDRDRLYDGDEVRRYRTNPRLADSDRDGFTDVVEVRAGTNPRSRLSHPAVGTAPVPPHERAPGTPPPAEFPTPQTAGLPAGWSPAQVFNDFRVDAPGAVVQDIQVNGDLTVAAPNVTLRRVNVRGGTINNWPGGGRCQNGLVIEDSTIEAGSSPDRTDYPAIQHGGYTARRVKIWNRGEGFRIGGKSASGCGPVTISDSFVKILSGDCGAHSDGLQGYDGNALTITNTTIDFNREGQNAGCGTSPFFYTDGQGNTSAAVDRLLVMGGGISFRLRMPGSVRGLKIVDDSWAYSPTQATCSVITPWDAELVEIDANYQVTRSVRPLPCN
jgi:hypothetical protein